MVSNIERQSFNRQSYVTREVIVVVEGSLEGRFHVVLV